MPKLSPRVKIVLIVCATILIGLLIVGLFRALTIGVMTFDDVLKVIGMFSDKKAMIGVM